MPLDDQPVVRECRGIDASWRVPRHRLNRSVIALFQRPVPHPFNGGLVRPMLAIRSAPAVLSGSSGSSLVGPRRAVPYVSRVRDVSPT